MFMYEYLQKVGNKHKNFFWSVWRPQTKIAGSGVRTGAGSRSVPECHGSATLVLKHTIQLRFGKFWIRQKVPDLKRSGFASLPLISIYFNMCCISGTPAETCRKCSTYFYTLQGLCVLCGGLPLRGANTAGTGGSRRRTATSDGLLRGTVSIGT
jgi:hypothetical protein